MPHQADFIFGQIRTDATLQAYAYSGQIGALCRIKRTSSSVKSGPTPRSRRALTQAKSGPYAASSGLHLRQIRTDATLQACAYSGQIGAFRRSKRTSPSVTTISDRLGSGALNAVRAHVVTYPAEGHLKDYAPPSGGSIASTALRKHAQKGKNFGHEGLGDTDLYYTS
jgi:hypothetical protein